MIQEMLLFVTFGFTCLCVGAVLAMIWAKRLIEQSFEDGKAVGRAEAAIHTAQETLRHHVRKALQGHLNLGGMN